MKYRVYVLLLLTFMPIHIFSQIKPVDLKPSENFIYFFDGTLLKSDSYTIKDGFWSDKYFYKNGEKIDFRKVKFYQSENGYYGNKIGTGEALDFISRTEAGTFDLFIEVDEAGGYVGSDGHYKSGGLTKRYYYARGFGDVKSLKYKNLKPDLSAFPNNKHPTQEKVILDLLDIGRKREKTKKTTLLTGLGVFLVGGIMYSSGQGVNDPGRIGSSKSEGNPTLRKIGLSVASIGLACSITSFIIPKPEKSYLDAIRIYNRYF